MTPGRLANLAHRRRARDLIDREYPRPLDVPALARAALMSPAHLSQPVDGTFEQVQAAGAELLQEPIDQPYVVRDCAFRDPSGNMIRISQEPAVT